MFNASFALTIKNHLATVAAWAAAAAVFGIFFLILGNILTGGLHALSWDFLSTPPQDAGRDGGIVSILVATALLLCVCVAVVIPVGLGTAVALADFGASGHRLAYFVRHSLDVLAGVPSIVFGLFGNALFCIYLGMGFSILSGGLTLACMVLPFFIRTVEQGIRTIPRHYHQNAAALGFSKTTTLLHILLPAATPAIVAGLVLGIGRALAETAALVFTSGYVDRMPESLLDSGRALSVHIYDLAMNVPGGNANAYASALTLLLLTLIINTLAQHLLNQFLAKQWRTSC